MDLRVKYQGDTTELEVANVMNSRTGFPTITWIMFSEAELHGMFKSYVKQRAAWRRRLRFVDPGMT